jgi:cytochrome c oxidase assembly factor CtaG
VSSLSALFFSLLPLALGAFSLADEVVWRGSSLVAFPLIAGAVGATWRVHRGLAREGHPSVIPGVWWIGGPLTALVAGIQLANGLGLFGAQSFGVHLLGPLLLLGMACLMFVAFLIYPSRR